MTLAAAQLESLRAFYRLVASGHPESRVVEFGDVQACVVPTTPGASIPNGVVYEIAGALAAALGDGRLVELYGELPFLVWLRPDDDEAAAACREAGLRLDGRPMLMAAALDEIEAPRGGVDVVPGSWAEVAAHYGMPAETFAEIADPAARIYAVPGAAVTVTLDVGSNLGVYFVATAPDARRRGYASELLRVAADDARGRGLETTALESSAMGQSVYAALGYRRLGELQAWERRL